MLARGDSQAIQSLPAAAPPPFPAWARQVHAPETDAEAAFLAGAALARLDAIVRQNPPWAGVWRRHLALRAAAASVRRAGRTEDAAALRDAFHLSRPGGDPGPAGKFLLAWKSVGEHGGRQLGDVTAIGNGGFDAVLDQLLGNRQLQLNESRPGCRRLVRLSHPVAPPPKATSAASAYPRTTS